MARPAPFSITPDAADYVLNRLKILPPGEEPVIIMETGLGEALDKRGEKIRWWYEGENFIIGYFDPAEKPPTEQIELLGCTMSITPEALKQLSGRTMALRRVEPRYGFMNIPRCVLVADSILESKASISETGDRTKRTVSIAALIVLGGFSGMGVVWIVAGLAVVILKIPESKFLPLTFPLFIAGWIIGATISFIFFRSLFKGDGKTQFAQDQREKKYLGYGGLGARLDWWIFMGIPIPLIAILVLALEPLAHTIGQKSGVAVGVIMVVFAGSLYFCDRLPRKLLFRLGVLGWVLTALFAYWLFRFGPESHL